MLRRAERIVAVLVYSVLVWLCVVGCGRRTPELMAISGLAPLNVTENDLMTLKGEGFVVGPEANVRFVGSVFRPGAEVERVDFRVSGSAVDGENLELVVTDAMLEHLCGSGEPQVAHATFEGDIEASFAPRTPGAPPIVGRARNVEFDAFRDATRATANATRAEVPSRSAGKNELLNALGFALAQTAAGRWEVTSVAEGSLAETSGLRVGDVVQRFSGVRVFSEQDIGVYPGQRVAQLEVLRQGQAAPFELPLPVHGLSPLGARGWALGLVLLGVMIVGVVVTRSKLSQWLVWLAIAMPRTRRVATPTQGVLPFLLVSAVFLLLALRRDVVPFELTLPLVGFLASLALAMSGMGWAYTERGFSLRALVAVWFRQLPLHLALGVALCALVLERGHASVWELAAFQTLSPLSYGAFASPPAFLVTAVCGVVCTAIVLSATPCQCGAPAAMQACVRGLGDVASLMLAALVLAVFFGGWSTRAEPPVELEWTSALYFQLRFTFAFFALGLMRRYLPQPPLAAVSAWAWKVLVPAACVALLLLPVWWAEIWPLWMRASAKGFLLGVGCVVALGLPLSMLLLRRTFGDAGRRTGLNPWL